MVIATMVIEAMGGQMFLVELTGGLGVITWGSIWQVQRPGPVLVELGKPGSGFWKISQLSMVVKEAMKKVSKYWCFTDIWLNIWTTKQMIQSLSKFFQWRLHIMFEWFDYLAESMAFAQEDLYNGHNGSGSSPGRWWMWGLIKLPMDLPYEGGGAME